MSTANDFRRDGEKFAATVKSYVAQAVAACRKEWQRDIRDMSPEVAQTAEVAELRVQVAELKAERSELKAELAELKAELAELKGTVGVMQMKDAELQRQCDANKTHCVNNEKRISKALNTPLKTFNPARENL
jgi:septal ring factor EnvC (AmiA/AmiB activator)